MLCDYAAKNALEAAVDMMESLTQSLPLPLHKKHGALLSALLVGARFWIMYQPGGNGAKAQFGVQAAGAKYVVLAKADDNIRATHG